MVLSNRFPEVMNVKSVALNANHLDSGTVPIRRSAQVAGKAISGIELLSLKENVDSRGSFTEYHQTGWGGDFDPAQFSMVKSQRNVMRGCHLHWHHDEYIAIITGAVAVGLKDVRQGSPTEGVWGVFNLYEQDPAALIFPRGLVHGWYFLEDSIHLQATSRTSSEYYDTDNLRVHWRDPDLGIPWPSGKAIVSELADTAPRLRDVLKTDP